MIHDVYLSDVLYRSAHFDSSFSIVIPQTVRLRLAQIDRQQLLGRDGLLPPAEGFLRRETHGRGALLQEMGRCQDAGDSLL